MVVVLFLLVLLAIAGLLSAVLKAVVILVAAVALSAVVIGWFAWWSLRRRITRAQQAIGRATTQVRVGRVLRPRPTDRPGSVDDRY